MPNSTEGESQSATHGDGLQVRDDNGSAAAAKSRGAHVRRSHRKHEFLRVLSTAVSKRGLGNPITDQELVSSVVSQLQVDSGFSFSHMLGLVLTFHGVNPNSSPQLTLPVNVVNSLSYQYQGYDYGNVEFPNEAQDRHRGDQPGDRDRNRASGTRLQGDPGSRPHPGRAGV